ncbi:NMCC_0638 family (lipo)protein [Phenylobacterium sp.]|jgi:hypothetical protein|uniref:NMCC_0638 family (lipo)protein n=1 Tax=Phenylobacterium sp. TaxID=1871053 RepID=UPI0037835633
MRLCLFPILVASSLFASTASAAPDPRAEDAANAFSGLCLSMFAGRQPDVDTKRFEITKFDEATKKRIKPHVQADALWNVQGRASGAMMLVHYEPTGLCVVEVAEADERSVQDSVRAVADVAARALGQAATEQPVSRKKVQGLTATNSSWRFPTPKGDVLVMVTTVPEPKFMIQHVITASYVR